MTETAISDLTVIVGAGGSWRAGLPTALELADDILGRAIRNRDLAEELRQWCRADHAQRRHPYDYLRFESLMAVIAELIDPHLGVLRCLERAQRPSPLQRRLAELAAGGARLITPNFDDLLERGLYDALRESDRPEVRAPMTIDAHSRTVLAPFAVPVVKLHGSLISHRGGRGRRVAAQVQATPERIIAHSPGLALTGRAAARLREAVDGRTLLVVGYSASDDLDVVPALRATRPARVIWVDHGNASEVTPFTPHSASGNASREDLLMTWSANGAQVAALRGATEIVLGSLGFGAIAMPERSGLPWRDDVTAWASQHQARIGNGMALAGMLWGQLERWDAKRNALLQAHRPGGTIEELGWTRSRRAYELAQTGFLSNGPDPQVLRWGRAARKYAREDGDRQAEAMAFLLLGRQAASNDDYSKAINLYHQAMDAVPKTSIVYAQAAERCASALVFVQGPREALALTDRILRLLGGPDGSIDTLVVGYDGYNSNFRTLIERWNGARWAVVPSPSIGPLDNVLSGVAKPSATSAWAVGYTSVSVPPRIYHRAMIEHWNGSTWRVVPAPQAGTSDSDLWGVTAFSATNAWAVGNENVGRFRFRPLVEHWNGTAWQLVRVPSPPLTGTGASLLGVAATSPCNIWAVGNYATGKRFQPLIEHFNGTRWALIPAPVAGSAELNRIFLLTPSNGWAVGLRGANTPTRTQALIEHWNGHRWTVARTSAVPGSSLADVLALSPRLAWAVGSAAAPHGYTRTLIERWNGRAWAITPSPNCPPASGLTGIGGTQQHLWAVGAALTNTLILRH